MKILIVVCAFNEEKNIKRCLDSLETSIKSHSSEDEIEVLIVDNSSSDDTAEIAKSYCAQNSFANYILIEHCFLCVSRNSYKIVEDADYVAYVDSDGYVDKNYIQILSKTIKDSNPDVLSGPVLEANGQNNIWECFYDSSLWPGKYLIGANMVFKKTLLDQVQGFPNLFKSRGDESGLLLKLRELKIDYRHEFNQELITYNIFCNDSSSIWKTQYLDGFRSYMISKMSANHVSHWINLTNRLVSSICLVLALILIFTYPKYSILLLGLSYASYGFRFSKYHSKLLIKVIRNPNVHLMISAVLVLLSKYAFDVGYLLQAFKGFDSENYRIESFENPVVLERSYVSK